MTIEELIKELQEAIKEGYPPDIGIDADVFDAGGWYTCTNIELAAAPVLLPISYLAINIYSNRNLPSTRRTRITIQELINQLQEAIKEGYPPDTDIHADIFDDPRGGGWYTRTNIELDADPSYLPIPYLALNIYENEENNNE
tara:strand:+ start:3890 stop:4315 length:426 start_codon:yes stop_codon:yes gene_type:complete